MIIQKSSASSWLVCFLVASKPLTDLPVSSWVNPYMLPCTSVCLQMKGKPAVMFHNAGKPISVRPQGELLIWLGFLKKTLDKISQQITCWGGQETLTSLAIVSYSVCLQKSSSIPAWRNWKRGDVLEVTGAPALLSSRRLDSTVPTTERGWKESGLVCLCIHPPIGRSRWSWSLLRCPPPVK